VLCQKLQKVFEMQSFGLDTGSQSFCHLFRPVDNTLLEISREIRCSDEYSSLFTIHDVSSRYTVVMETTQLVLSQF